MNTNPKNDVKAIKPEPVLQLRVRCDVRSGDDLATCQANLNKWRDRYYTAYNQAVQRGCI
jgi:hypothetical protein